VDVGEQLVDPNLPPLKIPPSLAKSFPEEEGVKLEGVEVKRGPRNLIPDCPGL
jgi:hypothetical protein